MSETLFGQYSVVAGVTFLISYMFFIMWNLARKSNAGRFGTLMIFMALGLGMVSFIAKSIMTGVMAVQ